MATYMASHLLQIFDLKNKDPTKKYLNPLTRDSFLRGVYVYRVHDQGELLAVILQLDKIISQNPNVKLVIIDSMAFPFRVDLQNNAHARSRALSQIAQHLYKVSFDHRVAIVNSNHTTVRFSDNKYNNSSSGSNSSSSSSGGGSGGGGGVNQHDSSSSLRPMASVVPALGEQWSHCVTNRIYMHYDEDSCHQRRSSSSSSAAAADHFDFSSDVSNSNSNSNAADFNDVSVSASMTMRHRVRVATLVKSPSQPLNSANYQVYIHRYTGL